MATRKTTTKTLKAKVTQRTGAEAGAALRPSSDLADIAVGIHNAMQDIEQVEDALIVLAEGGRENFGGLFYLLADALGSYLRELRNVHARLEAAAGAS
jgi:hypothetical protein